MKIQSKFLFRGLIATAAALMIVSCSSDQDFPDPNGASEETASLQTLVTGIEGAMRIDFDIYLQVVGVFGRENYYFEPSDPRYTGELLEGPIDNNGFLLTRHWDGRYRTVKNCNVLLSKAGEFDATTRAGAEGYARTMMAYQLLMVLNYLDENGIRIDVATEPVGPFVSKSEALSAIANMLDSANSSLSGAGGSFGFSLSSGFAPFNTPATFSQFNRAIRARVAAYQSDWQGVMDALGGSFIDANGAMSTGAYHNFSTNTGDRTNVLFESPTADFVKYMVHPSYQTDAEAGDLRYSSKVVERPASTTFDGLTTSLGVGIYSSSTAPIPVIRNEELLLLRAEANIGMGNLSAAEGDINIVRAAAGLGPATLTSANASTQLLHERRYSLFSEGHRWIDMRRYGLLGTLPVDRANDVIIEMMPRPFNEQ